MTDLNIITIKTVTLVSTRRYNKDRLRHENFKGTLQKCGNATSFLSNWRWKTPKKSHLIVAWENRAWYYYYYEGFLRTFSLSFGWFFFLSTLVVMVRVKKSHCTPTEVDDTIPLHIRLFCVVENLIVFCMKLAQNKCMVFCNDESLKFLHSFVFIFFNMRERVCMQCNYSYVSVYCWEHGFLRIHSSN